MPLRIACPRCSAAMTVSERGVGHVVTCPKCRGKMVIPAATAEAVEPHLDVIEFTESPSPPPPRRPPSEPLKRTAKRTVVEIEEGEPIPRRSRSNARSRPGRSSRPRSPGPIVVLAVGIVLTLTAGAGAVWLAVRAAEKMNPVARRGADASVGSTEAVGIPPADKAFAEQPVEAPDRPNEPPPPVENRRDDPLPAGWSYNSPSLGFKAAWPVEKGADGFAPTASIYAGTSEAFGGSAWGIGLGRAEAGHVGVSSMVLPDVAIEPEQTLDNYMAKITRRMPTATVKRITVYGRTGREITFVENGRTVVHRATIVKNVIWTAQAVYLDNHAESARRFLNSFQAL